MATDGSIRSDGVQQMSRPLILTFRLGFAGLLGFAAFLGFAGLPGFTAFASAQGPTYAPRVVIERAFPAITDPKLIPADQSTLGDNELVIGVEVDGEARAYPINQLTGPRREIINDTLAGTAIAATW